MSEQRLIDANKLKERVMQEIDSGQFSDTFVHGLQKAIWLIDNAPTVELTETEVQEVLNKRCMTAVANEYLIALHGKTERPQGECKTCKHYKPIMQRDIFGYSPRGDGYCDIRRMTQDGELEINVNDDFYCKYYERGDENGKS